MAYTVFARKYRPQTFEELVGQEHVARTLGNAITQDRVAHAFLFTGVRGVGKTTTARLLAKALNCEQGPTISPCSTCASCVAIAAGTPYFLYRDDFRNAGDSEGFPCNLMLLGGLPVDRWQEFVYGSLTNISAPEKALAKWVAAFEQVPPPLSPGWKSSASLLTSAKCSETPLWY